MSDSYFSLIAHGVDAAAGTLSRRVAAGPLTEGPWASHLEHGGPPNALAVATAETLLHAVTGRDDLAARRLAADFVGAVPVGELDVHGRVVRAARSAALVEVTVAAAGRDCLVTRTWFVRDTDTAAVAPPLPPAVAVPADDARSSGHQDGFGYGTSLQWVFVEGALAEPGPGTAWVRPRTELGTGEALSPLARTVLVGDSGSGVSAELDWSQWSFVNVDLDVHLARPAVGDWLRMSSVTQLGAHGSALARSTFADAHGEYGRGLQTLVLTPAR
ncbi:thioesterase family protein [Jatrophihabitans fulvus]